MAKKITRIGEDLVANNKADFRTGALNIQDELRASYTTKKRSAPSKNHNDWEYAKGCESTD